jgi:Domain of unknown function (DUF4276)
MVTELRIYFEGDNQLKPGFHGFMKEIKDAAGKKRCRFQLVEAKGKPVQDFRDALKTHPDAWNVLLLDSEGPIDGSLADLCRSKKLDPKLQDSVFWMVQVMESWFLADVAALKEYYSNGFQENAVKGNPEVEKILKTDVYSKLKRATKNVKRGEYDKTKHAPALLASIDVSLVRAAAPNCARMFRIILERLAEN